MTCFKKAVFSFHWQSIYPEWKSACLSQWLSVLSGVLQIGCFSDYEDWAYNLFSWDLFVRPTWGRRMNMSLFLFQQFMPWRKKNKIIPPKLIWFSSPEKEKPTNLLAKAREIRCSSVRPAPCVSHSDLCRCAQEHLLSALGYVECTDRWARVRLSKQCAGGCLSEALTTFHSLFIAFISFGL